MGRYLDLCPVAYWSWDFDLSDRAALRHVDYGLLSEHGRHQLWARDERTIFVGIWFALCPLRFGLFRRHGGVVLAMGLGTAATAGASPSPLGVSDWHRNDLLPHLYRVRHQAPHLSVVHGRPRDDVCDLRDFDHQSGDAKRRAQRRRKRLVVRFLRSSSLRPPQIPYVSLMAIA